MRYTDKERYAMPERRPVSDPADIEPLADNFQRADERLQKMEADKAGRDELKAHAEKKTLDHPDGSVTDEKIGNRTIGGLTGKLAALFSAIGNTIKGITGKENWNDAPPTTLAAAKAHTDSRANPHGVTKAQVGLGSVDNTTDIAKPISTAQATALANKVDKVTGKQLSTEDYTTAEKTKLSGVEIGANNYVLPVVQATGQSAMAVMSQKAVTDEIAAKGGGDMLKSVYDTNNNGSADKADKLTTARTIALSGDVTGSASFDGSANVTITATMASGMKVVDY